MYIVAFITGKDVFVCLFYVGPQVSRQIPEHHDTAELHGTTELYGATELHGNTELHSTT